MIDPFFAITIGGDYQECIRRTKEGHLTKNLQGSRKIYLLTKNLLNVERNQTKELNFRYDGELDHSY